MAFDYKGIKNFMSRLESINNSSDSLTNTIANKIAENALETAKAQYGGTSIQVEAEQAVNGNTSVVASGAEVNFMEFGTGVIGQGTYQGQLPTQTIEFESPKGFPQTTQGWEYNYQNPRTKKGDGWYYNGEFTQGETAQMQMFNTAKQVKENISEIVKDAIAEFKAKKR